MKWLDFLNETFQGHQRSINELQKFAASLLLLDKPDLVGRYKKMLALIGPGCNGKSVIANILIKMIGEENCLNYSIEEFFGRFSVARIKDKKLLLIGEFPTKKSKRFDLFFSILRTICDGGKLIGDRKYKKPIVFTPNCKVLFVLNQNLPENIPEKIHNRIINLSCLNIPSKPDPYLFKKLTLQIDSIKQWALEGLNEI